MKKILTIIGASLLALSLSFAQDTAPITVKEVAEIKSNTVVTGIVVHESAGKPSSAIINDRIVWLEDVVTVREKGKVIVTPRDKRERDSFAPSLRLVRVEATSDLKAPNHRPGGRIRAQGPRCGFDSRRGFRIPFGGVASIGRCRGASTLPC